MSQQGDPNAAPGQGHGGYYPQQGGYNQQGGYYPQQGGYYPQQGGYYPQQGGYYPQQGGYYPQQGGYYPQQGGYNQQQGGYNRNNNNQYGGYQGNNNNNNSQPVKEAPSATATASPSAATTNKLSLGGGKSSEPVAMPKRKGGATLVLGNKGEVKEKQPAPIPEEIAPSPAVASPASTETPPSPAASPASPVRVNEAAKKAETKAEAKAPLSAEELKEQVKKEIAKQRKTKKEYVRDPRPHYNIVFCGHVDAGKSTISGHLLADYGLVDQREMDKLRREAETLHREGWEYAYVMDVSEEERAKGKTHETGAAYFETDKRRVTVLDAPGHKAFVPSMIGGATQADICVLVISSRSGEFETGFERGGQTREHAMLVRTCGVKQMICVINKMDDSNWEKERYDEIVGKLRPFLRQNGYDEKSKSLIFIPVSGLSGMNLTKNLDPAVCGWFSGPSVMEFVNELVIPDSKSEDDVLCVPLVGAYKDDGKVFLYGKVEAGSMVIGDKLQILPAKTEVVVEGISLEATEFEKAFPGDNVHIRVRGIEENDVHGGYVATSIPTTLRAVEYFQARVVILDVKNIICAGSKVMMHIHSAQEEVSFHKLLAKVDKKTGETVEKEPTHVRAGDVVIARMELERPLVIEPHKDFDKMGRFMLREDGKTIAIGLVMKLYESTKSDIRIKAKK